MVIVDIAGAGIHTLSHQNLKVFIGRCSMAEDSISDPMWVELVPNAAAVGSLNALLVESKVWMKEGWRSVHQRAPQLLLREEC